MNVEHARVGNRVKGTTYLEGIEKLENELDTLDLVAVQGIFEHARGSYEASHTEHRIRLFEAKLVLEP